LYTSGTTGRSKGAMLTHGNLASNAVTLHRHWQFRPGDVLLHALPIFHVHGLFVALHCAFLNGSTVIFQSGFDVDAIIERLPEATVFMGVPTFYTRLLAEPRFRRELCANMRVFIAGSAPLTAETFTAFLARTGQAILERYGMSEAGMIASNPYDGERRPGTVGAPLPGVTLRIADQNGSAVPGGEVGSIEISGPNVFRGYWEKPEKTAAEFTDDGFFITGDLGFIDADGYLHIVGRSRDMVISGGYNVYPREVEAVLDELDGIQESAVIGVPHADYGEAVVAAVVAEASAQPELGEATMIARLKPLLASYKVPKRIVVMAELPRNAMGKVQKNLLRERLSSLFEG
ncbi:MAG: AMP-binding protein, partial [Gammaproteobacteria bacterium]|nr:AMP-binding protein [Gammaproteobacteria bacterium]NNM01107.1 AMP-binding protein [Gammaproteobacteria bacterium]